MAHIDMIDSNWIKFYNLYRSGNGNDLWFNDQMDEFVKDNLPIGKLVQLRKFDSWNVFEAKEFKKLIENLLISGGVSSDLVGQNSDEKSLPVVSKKYREQLLDDASMTYFRTAFTHVTEDANNNYETLEFLGDLTFNKCVGWYLPRRFPQLFDPEATDILTRLKIFIIQSKQMGTLAEKVGFLKFIHYDPSSLEFKKTNTQKILEDVFESCFGAIEWVLDSRLKIGVGYTICYGIISKILDSEKYSLRFSDLVDAITRLKEIFDKFKYLGTIQYITIKESAPLLHVRIKQTMPNGHTRILGEAQDPHDLSSAKQSAAEQAIDILAREGIKHPDEGKYEKFCNLSN